MPYFTMESLRQKCYSPKNPFPPLSKPREWHFLLNLVVKYGLPGLALKTYIIGETCHTDGLGDSIS